MTPRKERRGNAFIEYLILTTIVFGATIAFVNTQLQDPRSRLRRSIEEQFLRDCERIMNTGVPHPGCE